MKLLFSRRPLLLHSALFLCLISGCSALTGSDVPESFQAALQSNAQIVRVRIESVPSGATIKTIDGHILGQCPLEFDLAAYQSWYSKQAYFQWYSEFEKHAQKDFIFGTKGYAADEWGPATVGGRLAGPYFLRGVASYPTYKDRDFSYSLGDQRFPGEAVVKIQLDPFVGAPRAVLPQNAPIQPEFD